MKSAPPSQDNHGEALFIPDFSEGAEVGVYLALLELIDEGLLITGDETIIDVNSAACRLLGRSYRQLAGQPLADLFADGHAFLEAREKLLIRSETRGLLGLVLPDGRVHDFPYIAAPRLRPGIHAIVLGHERLAIETAPAPVSAPADRSLALHFQPQVDIRNGVLYAGEALLPELDAWTLSVACRAAAAWPHVRGRAPVVSVNISAGQLSGGGLPGLVRTSLTVSRLDPCSLELSIDVRAFLLPETDIAPTLRALSDMRVRLAIDNFGRDPASISQLDRYRFSVLKLDAALIEQVGRDDEGTAFIEALIQMAAPLGIRVMARGVQGRAQQDFLLALGCDLQQGPFIGEAQDERLFASFLSEWLFC